MGSFLLSNCLSVPVVWCSWHEVPRYPVRRTLGDWEGDYDEGCFQEQVRCEGTQKEKLKVVHLASL